MSYLMLAGRILAVTVILSIAQMTHAEPTPTIAPPQAWVRDTPIPAPNPALSESPLQFLLSSAQVRIRANGSEIYMRTVMMPQTTAGLQAVGNVAIPWNSERSDLTIHRVSIVRGSQVIDLLKGQDLVVLRRENNLEHSMLDGVRTVVLPAPGLQVGDRLDLAFTQRERPGTIAAKPEALATNADLFANRLVERRFQIEDGVKFEWKADSMLPAPRKDKTAGWTEIAFTQKDYVPAKVPTNAPSRYRFPMIQLTSYASWQEVAAVMKPLFDTARKPVAGSALLTEADTIAKAQAAPEARMLAALRLSQEKVRYVALALGEGSHIPATSDQTWARKFGDCKGKVALLLALLDRLGVAAEPMLTNGASSDLLGERLPSLYLFDHVVVRAHIAGRDYILDPTNYGQRTLEEFISPGFEWGLPVVDGASLIRLPRNPPTSPLVETEVVWDATKGFDQQVPYIATLTYRGTSAAGMRALQVSAPDKASFEGLLKKSIDQIEDKLLKVVAINPEASQGEFTVRFEGKAPMRWTTQAGAIGRQFYFDHSVPAWKVDFERAEGPWKDLPVRLSFPVWIRSNETVTLPSGVAGFTLRGQPIDSKVAGTEIKRSMSIANGRAIAVSDFRRTVPEITAAEARAATAPLRQIRENFASVVAPRDYSVSRAEVKTILAEPGSAYDDFVRRGRLLMDQSQRTRAIEELGKAINADGARAGAYALQAINYHFLSRRKEAQEKLAKAVALDPANRDVLRARGVIAWREHDSAQALEALGKAIEVDPNYYELYLIRAQVFAGTGRYDEAMMEVRRAIDLSGNAISLGTVAQVEAASGRIEEALASLDKAALSDREDLAMIQVLRGDYLLHLGRAADAKTAYRAAKLEMTKLIAKQTADVPRGPQLDLQVMELTRNYEEAEPLADRIVASQRYPSASQLAKRAWLRAMNGKYEGAIRDARDSLELDPTQIDASLALALGYLRTGKLAEADAQLTKALAIDETNALLWYARAIARGQLVNRAGSLKDLEIARLMQIDVALHPAFLGLKAD